MRTFAQSKRCFGPALIVPVHLVFRLVLVLALLAGAGARAQFGKRFSSPNYVPPTVAGAYYYGSGQLAAFIETTPADEEAWLFINNTTGQLHGSLRLDANHGAMSSPDGREILVAGFASTNNQPVYFAGRYNATNLQPIAEMQIDVDANDGYTLSGEVSPDGSFIFRGIHSLSLANVIAKYGPNLALAWGVALNYGAALPQPGLEAFPLASGDVGFWVYYQGSGGDGTIYTTNVVGLLNGANGQVKWDGVYVTTQVGLTQDDHNFIFGPDGSLFLSIKTVNLLSPETNTVRLARVTPGGTLAYSKTLTVTNAVQAWQYYFGGHALVYYEFQESGADRIQFLVLDENGNLAGNRALNCELRGGGKIKLTAARREGTDYAFLRLECGFTSESPQQTLARLDLNDGAIDLRRLPAPAPSVETYEVVTTPKGDALSPHNSFRGIAAVTTAVVGNIDQVGGGGTVGFYELPADGSFPDCLPLSASSVTVGTPLAPQVADAVHINLADGMTATAHAMPGMTAPLLRPTIQPTTSLTGVTVCPDDGTTAPPRPTIAFIRTSPAQAEIRFATVAGFRYGIERTADFANFTNWVEIASANGDGEMFIHPISLTGGGGVYRCAVRPMAP